MWSLIPSDLISALVGAVIGGMFTSRATTKAHRLDRLTEAVAEDERTRRTLKMIDTEMAAAWDIYQFEYLTELQELGDDEPYFATLPIGENPFVVYESMAPQLANVPEDLASKIVRLYMRTKGLVKSIEMNNKDNEIVIESARNEWKRQLDRIHGISHDLTQDQVQERLSEVFNLEQIRVANQLGMGQTANALKTLSKEIQESLTDLRLLIQNYLARSYK